MAQFDYYFVDGPGLDVTSQTGKHADSSNTLTVGVSMSTNGTIFTPAGFVGKTTILATPNSGSIIIGADVTARAAGGVSSMNLTVIIDSIEVAFTIGGTKVVVQSYTPGTTYNYDVKTGPAPPTNIGDSSFVITATPSVTVNTNWQPQITIIWHAFITSSREETGPNFVTFNMYCRSVAGSPNWRTFLANTATATMSDSMAISDLTASRTVSLSRSVADSMNIQDNVGFSGAGFNSMFFVDMSTGEPLWNAWGGKVGGITGVSLGVLETSTRKRMLALGAVQLKRMLEVGQGPFIIGQGVIGRDYVGNPLQLPAVEQFMLGNPEDQFWQHYSNLVFAADNLQPGTTIQIFLDGSTVPISIPFFSLGNGFYRAWINKYARRILLQFTFDQNDYFQNIRRVLYTARQVSTPQAIQPFISQTPGQSTGDIPRIEGGGNASSQFGQISGGGGA